MFNFQSALISIHIKKAVFIPDLQIDNRLQGSVLLTNLSIIIKRSSASRRVKWEAHCLFIPSESANHLQTYTVSQSFSITHPL